MAKVITGLVVRIIPARMTRWGWVSTITLCASPESSTITSIMFVVLGLFSSGA